MKKQTSKKCTGCGAKSGAAIHAGRIVRTILCAGLVCAAITAALFSCRKKAVENDVTAGLTIQYEAAPEKTYLGRTPAGAINGEPFFQEDLNVYMAELRAAVAAHYGRKYGLNGMGADFWDTDFDGQTPKEFQTKLALRDLAKNVIIIQEARKRGIDTPASYHDLEAERTDWNAPTDEVVYGPKTLAPAEYNSYRITGISDELKTALLKKELAPTEAQMRASFNSLPEDIKSAPYLAEGSVFTWNGGAASPEKDIRAAINRRLSPEDTAASLAASFPGLAVEDFSIDNRYISKEDPYEQELAGLLEFAGKGAFVNAPEDRPSLYYVTRKEGGGKLTFEQAPVLGRNKWINDQFDAFIGQKIREAKIVMYKETAG